MKNDQQTLQPKETTIQRLLDFSKSISTIENQFLKTKIIIISN